MRLEDIYKEWDVDCIIDRTELGSESLKIPSLHNKYYKVFTSERLLLHKLEADMKQLKLEKYKFYSEGPSKEQIDKGWELPARGLILKADLPLYMDADKDIIQLSLKIGHQKEKIELLESIIRSLQSSSGFSTRTTQIKNAIEWTKFTQGS